MLLGIFYAVFYDLVNLWRFSRRNKYVQKCIFFLLTSHAFYLYFPFILQVTKISQDIHSQIGDIDEVSFFHLNFFLVFQCHHN